MSVSLTGPILEAVRELGRRHGLTEGQVTRRAIRLMKDVSDEVDAGSVFRLQPRDGQEERIKFIGLFS